MGCVFFPALEGGVAERSEVGVGEAQNPAVTCDYWLGLSPHPSPAKR